MGCLYGVDVISICADYHSAIKSVVDPSVQKIGCESNIDGLLFVTAFVPVALKKFHLRYVTIGADK